MYPLKNDNRCRLNRLRNISPLMQCKVISRDLAILPREQLVQLFEGEVEVERARMVEVVIGGVFVLAVGEALVEHVEGDEGDLALEGRLDSIAKARFPGGRPPRHPDKERLYDLLLMLLLLVRMVGGRVLLYLSALVLTVDLQALAGSAVTRRRG